jgi:hypothetical protein
MKSTLKFASTTALLLAMTTSFSSAQEKMSCAGMKTMSEKQVTSLIASSKTAEDHHKLACYFRNEARNEEERAKYHEDMAKLYEHSSNAKRDMVKHCKDFADEARKAAASDNQLADEHEKMAMEAK